MKVLLVITVVVNQYMGLGGNVQSAMILTSVPSVI